jgi:hypothetical protein
LGDIGVTPVEDISAAQQIAARLAGITDIRDVRLMKSSAEIVNLPTGEPYLAYDFDSEAVVEYEPGGESFVVRGTYKVFIRSSSGDDTEDAERHASPIARIEFEHAALFVINTDGQEPPKPEELNAYAVSTGQFALYPYVREYIYNVTGRLGLPPLTVGVLRLPALPSESKLNG